jgi:integrase
LWIPADIKPVFRRQEFKQSLKTKSKKIAAKLLDVWRERTEKLFYRLRSGELTDTEVKQLVENYIKYSLDRTDERRLEKGGTLDSDMHDPERDALLMLEGERKERYISKQLDAFLDVNQVQIDRTSTDYKRLCRDIADAHMRTIHDINVLRDAGDYSDRYYLADAKQPQPTTQPQTTGMLLSDLMKKYVTEKVVTGAWKPASQKQYEDRYKLLLEILGNQPVDSITRDDVIATVEKLKRFPSNRNKKAAYKGKSVDEILAMESISNPMAEQTVKHYIESLSTLFSWAEQCGHLDKNIAVKTAPRVSTSPDKQRDVFSLDDLQKTYDLYKSAPYRKTPHKFISEEEKWIVFIAMWQGVRLEEACQIYADDVVDVDGIWCFDIKDDKDKSLKGASSRRLIPLHPKLTELGFVEYCKGVDHERIFPSLKANKFGKYSGAFSQKVNRSIDNYVNADDKVVFHSLRHTFDNTLKQAGCTEQQIAELSGRKTGSTTMERYGKKYEPKVLLEVLKKVDYDLKY